MGKMKMNVKLVQIKNVQNFLIQTKKQTNKNAEDSRLLAGWPSPFARSISIAFHLLQTRNIETSFS